MATHGSFRMRRRDMLRLGAGGAGMFVLTASGFAVPKGFSAGSDDGGITVYLEAFPTSPLILDPFKDVDNNQLPIPQAEPVTDPMQLAGGVPDPMRQDCIGVGKAGSAAYRSKYGQELGAHQIWPGQGPTKGYFTDTTPNVYDIKLEVGGHSFTKSLVQPIDSFGRNVIPPGS